LIVEINVKLPLVALLLSLVPCLAGVPDGSVLQTTDAAHEVQLENGVAFRLAAHSVGTIYADHAVLDQGAARIGNFAGYNLDAGQLEIESETPGTQAVIRLEQKTIEVASIGGSLRVIDGGAMLTRVASGSKMSFQNSGASPNPSGATPAQTGAAPGPKKHSETKTWLWVIGGISAAALAIGLTAAAQGKSPF
jgi:hypothetical protein